jgi:hypothetical protein
MKRSITKAISVTFRLMAAGAALALVLVLGAAVGVVYLLGAAIAVAGGVAVNS